VLSRDDTGTRRRFHPVTTRFKEETKPVTTQVPGEDNLPWQSRYQEKKIFPDNPVESLETGYLRSYPEARDNPTSRGVPRPVTTCCLEEIQSRDTSPAL
jgi:hypothetical protein